MKEQFAPFLGQIMPSVLGMASLKPSMGIEGLGGANIEDVLSEVRPD